MSAGQLAFVGWGFRSVIVALLQLIIESVIFCLQVRTTHSNSVTPMWYPIAHQDTHATGGSTLAGCFGVHLRYSLPPLSLSSACRCLNTLDAVFELLWQKLQGERALRPAHASATNSYCLDQNLELILPCPLAQAVGLTCARRSGMNFHRRHCALRSPDP